MNDNNTLDIRLENITPILNVKDISKSAAFYAMLGFKNANWGDENFTCIYRDNCAIYLCRNGQGVSGTWVWIGFDGDIFSLQEKFKTLGIKITLPPTNYSWAYEMQIEDPDGHILRFGTDPNNKQPFIDQ